MKKIQLLTLIADLREIKDNAVHKTWNFTPYKDSIKIFGDIDEISFYEIIELLIKDYPFLYSKCFLNKGYIYIK